VSDAATPTVPGPHPDPSTPTFVPPELTCDSHCHVFGPVARFPFSADSTYTPPDAGFDDLQRLHRHLGIDRGVVVQASCHGSDNRALVDALHRGGSDYAGVAMIDAHTTDDELAEMDAAGVRGIRFNFVSHLDGPPPRDEIEAAVARVAPLGWHVVLHVEAHELEAQFDLITSLPTVVVIDHMARIRSDDVSSAAFRRLLELLESDQYWVKISCADRFSVGGQPYHDMAEPVAAVLDTARDRVLWGTDWPHPNQSNMPDDGLLVDLIPVLVPSADDRQAVLVDNPARLYGFR